MALFSSFGGSPSGKELELIHHSPEYRNGAFQNLEPTAMMVDKASMLAMTWRFMNKPRDTRPPAALPSVKTKLATLNGPDPIIVWFGHSSYFMRIDGQNILVDPVFGGHASPFRFGASAFAGADAYTVDDLPAIDLLIITHDHYDHLDHRTIRRLRHKIKNVITSLGVSAHLISWGIQPGIIKELDWNQRLKFESGLTITALPARHFSGRTFKRNQTLWSSFLLQSSNASIYIGGDSGYGKHFKSIGDQYGPIDLVILETGQYNKDWPLIHMMPEQAVQAAIDLRGKWLLPVHWGKFALAFHPWSEPVERATAAARLAHVNITTPLIGQPVIVNEEYPMQEWWRELNRKH